MSDDAAERPGAAPPPAVPPQDPATDDAAHPVPRPAQPPRLISTATWRSSLREFAVIVAGVLVALMAQAFWESRQEREIERAYLDQLVVDARENRVRLIEAIAVDSTAADALRHVLRVVVSGADAPADSLAGWFALMGRSSDFKPVTGTHRALLGTGELRLVRDENVRTAVMRYASFIDSESERLEQFRGMVIMNVPALMRVIPFMQRAFSGGFSADHIDVSALRRNPEVPVVLVTLQAASLNKISGLRRLLEATDGLLATLASHTTAAAAAPGGDDRP